MNKTHKIFVVIGFFLFVSNSFSETNSVTPAEPNNDNQKRIHDFVERGRLAVKQLSNPFSCQGIGILDNGSALDGEVYYFHGNTRELISISGMVFCISASTETHVDPNKFCPPPELRTDFCTNKYKKMKYDECVSHKKWHEERYKEVLPPCTLEPRKIR